MEFQYNQHSILYFFPLLIPVMDQKEIQTNQIIHTSFSRKLEANPSYMMGY